MTSPLPDTLSGISVAACMRRMVNRLNSHSTISGAIATLIKYKIGGLLVVDKENTPVGVVSKTNLVAAYYAELGLDSPLEHIMTGPPIFCRADDPLEKGLEIMKENRVYRLYVLSPDDDEVVGALAYPDIVGLLYEFCSRCERSIYNRPERGGALEIRRSFISECMTRQVQSVFADDALHQVLEAFSIHHVGALLVVDQEGYGRGVISKTDLILAYNHGVSLDTAAREIMSAPLRSCAESDLIEEAIRTMIFSDVHRLFVRGGDGDDIVGVFSLTDAARRRSGSCHACLSSRIQVTP